MEDNDGLRWRPTAARHFKRPQGRNEFELQKVFAYRFWTLQQLMFGSQTIEYPWSLTPLSTF